MDSNGRFAVVTGATRGIGRHTALALARAGLDVAITGRTAVEGAGRIGPRVAGPGSGAAESSDEVAVPGSLATTAAEIEALGRRCLPVALDLSSHASVPAAAQQILQTWGAPAVLVNNAIVHRPHQRFLDSDAATLHATWTGNFAHQVAFTQAILPAMVAAGGGLIVDVVSSSATNDPPGPPGEGGWGLAYAASKAAFGRIAGVINAEYAGAGVRAFNLDPAFVVTESGAARGGTQSLTDGFGSADPGAIGAVVAWLLEAPAAESDRFLGKTIWAPTLAAKLAAEPAPAPGAR
jgi:NAD(P)-dependent dehydrogenase (short-subunit alcohol dehydrogenase family)